MILFDPLIENPSLLCLPFAYKNFKSLNCGFRIFYKCVWTSSGHVFCWRHRWVIKIFPFDPISGSHFSVLEVSRKNGKSPNHFKIILRDCSSRGIKTKIWNFGHVNKKKSEKMEYSDDEIVFFKTLNLLDPRLQTLDNTEYRFYITKGNLKEMFLFSHDQMLDFLMLHFFHPIISLVNWILKVKIVAFKFLWLLRNNQALLKILITQDS